MERKYYLKTENLTVGYGKNPLISGIEIGVKRGEILTLIGPNGAGKSTILKSIAKQLALLGGKVLLENEDMAKLSGNEVAKKLSVMLTGQIQSELMTCEDVVSSGRYPYTGTLGILSKEDRNKVWDALELVHATELASSYFDQISDGQRQRVLLARAICQEPDVIVLDEPTSFLDIRHKLELITILKQLVREKDIAVVMSLHELDLAMKVSDTIVCVNGDRIEKCGSPEDIFSGDYINQLYHMTKGSFLAEYGVVELERTVGEPTVFVIGGGGTGIATYRYLQRKGIAFAVGVLQKNDADYAIASALATKVIVADAFEPITEQQIKEAEALMDTSRYVICTLTQFGTMNQQNAKLLENAKQSGKLVELYELSEQKDIWKG
ncbi:MAG: ABC transporter ATP-binding protein [Eubacteriales bacterium]|nr:ABC transporter ATP-binding protein [Eubacteriales bacterium]